MARRTYTPARTFQGVAQTHSPLNKLLTSTVLQQLQLFALV